MSLFTSRSARPRRAIRPPLVQRPTVRIGAAVAGTSLIAAAVAGSMLQFSFAGDTGEGPTSPQVVTTTHSAAPDPSDRPLATTTPRTFVFHTCREVREAGAYPLRRGERGYGPHLDRNGNGLACEPE